MSRLESILSEGDVFSQTLEHLRLAAEGMATMSHHRGLNGDQAAAQLLLIMVQVLQKQEKFFINACTGVVDAHGKGPAN